MINHAAFLFIRNILNCDSWVHTENSLYYARDYNDMLLKTFLYLHIKNYG